MSKSSANGGEGRLPAKVWNIVLFTAPELGFGRGVIRGVFGYRQEHQRPWLLRVCHVQEGEDQRQLLRSIKADAVIAAEAVLRGDGVTVPAVQLLFSHMPVAGPFVGIDDRAVGVAAGGHLLERGFRSMAMVRRYTYEAMPPREAGFREALSKDGIVPEVHVAGRSGGFYDGSPGAAVDLGWLQGLPKPLGLFADTDAIGHSVAEHCRLAGLKVPEEVAIVAVDNDQLVCELTYPPLSSVALPWESVGYLGAKALDRLLETGEREADRWLGPLEVVTRRSSDTLAIEDADVVEAVRFIHANAHKRLAVQDVAATVAVSRRTLELRFRKALGRSVFDELVRTRVRRASQDLSGSDLPLAAVARRAGFPSASKLSAVFRRETGRSPTEYRKFHRLPRGP